MGYITVDVAAGEMANPGSLMRCAALDAARWMGGGPQDPPSGQRLQATSVRDLRGGRMGITGTSLYNAFGDKVRGSARSLHTVNVRGDGRTSTRERIFALGVDAAAKAGCSARFSSSARL